ncbi:MAG: hypothetical protein ABIJ45_14800 [Candidatus Zixiibacteriota bacterium]
MNRISSLIVLLSIIIICAGIVKADDSGDFSFRAGFGYDLISQEYFLDSLVTDSLQAILLTKDYFNDKKGLLYITYNHDKKGDRVAEIGWEQTPELYRLLGRSHFDFKGKTDRFDSDINFEFKNRYRGDIVEGEEYLLGNARLRYRHKISNYWESSALFKVERAVFDSIGHFAYNYTKFSGGLGLNLLTDDFNNYYILFAVEKRLVSDSSDIDYWAFKTNSGYWGSLGNGQLSADLALEIRKYNQKDEVNDYTFALFDTKYRRNIGENSFINPEIELEFYDFASENSYNQDYFLGRTRFVLGHYINDFTVSLGPEIEILSSKNIPELDDSYTEIGLFTGVDFLLENRLTLFIDNEVGLRGFKNESDVFSNYTFERIDLIGNFKILQNLGLDLIFSGEWEWHENSDNNNRLFLVSSSLFYSF